jgi:hypothetical protein|tara:strand:- start:2093 stop:2359 length:267 start_codon:yes stop_codon:yes gene_type:complete
MNIDTIEGVGELLPEGDPEHTQTEVLLALGKAENAVVIYWDDPPPGSSVARLELYIKGIAPNELIVAVDVMQTAISRIQRDLEEGAGF